MYLRKYEPSDFTFLAKWVSSPALLFQFAGTDFTYPLTQTQLEAYSALYPFRAFYMACHADHQPFAFGEIIPQESNIPRLGRLLVGDSNKRGQGLGTRFVHLLVQECVQRFGFMQIDLYVLRDNLSARRCYEKLGFQTLPNESFQLELPTEVTTIDKMRLEVANATSTPFLH